MNDLKEKMLIERCLAVFDRHYQETEDLSLGTGIMGKIIFLYWLSRKEDVPCTEAKRLLGDVTHRLTGKMRLGISDGLLGIASGICWLVHNGFVQGNLDNILSVIDSHLYRLLSDKSLYSKLEKKIDGTLLDVMLYLTFRLKISCTDASTALIMREQLMDVFDQFYQHMEMDIFVEPLPGKLSFKLPKLLIAMANMQELGVYDDRIKMCLNEIKPHVLSVFPYSMFNRCFMYYALLKVYRIVGDMEWKRQACLLVYSMDSQDFFSKAFKTYDIFLDGGFGGACLLMMLANNMESVPVFLDRVYIYEELTRRFYLTIEKMELVNPKSGLLGMLGLIILLDKIKNKL